MMCGLILLKHIRNVSDESIVEQFSENAYYQYFCGNLQFEAKAPCASSDLVHFRRRIGTDGMELILQESIRVAQVCDKDDSSANKVAYIDSTVQQKNITFPTDTELHLKIIDKCHKMARENDIKQRQTYSRKLKKYKRTSRFDKSKKNQPEVKKARKRIKIIAGRLVRELLRRMPENHPDRKQLELYGKVLAQKKNDKNKIYSLHEPDVCCMCKGKKHKKYEFGNSVSITTNSTGIIIGALSFRNQHDSKTIDESLKQIERLINERPKLLIGDRGYRGKARSGTTEVMIPKPPLKRDSRYKREQKAKLMRNRASIESRIGHLKQDHRLCRNWYKGIVGDEINVMLAAAAYNFKRAMRALFVPNYISRQ